MTAQHRTAAVALAGAVLLTATACGTKSDATDPKKGPSQAPAPSTSPSPADPQAAEKKAVLATYSSMWAEQMKAYGKADDKGTDLKKYAALNALSKLEVDLAQMKAVGTVGTGEVGHTPKVTALDAGGKLPKATIQDCIDLSRWKAVRTKTGQPVALPTNQPRRYVATASAEKWKGRWMVTDYTPDGAHPC